MGQHPDPDPYRDEDEDLEALGGPVYEGSGLSVRALTADELQRFLDAHVGQPARPIGRGWATLDPPGHPAGVPRTPSTRPRSAGRRPCPPGHAWPRAAGTAAPAAPPSRPTGSSAPPSGPAGPTRPPGGPPQSRPARPPPS